MTTTQIPTPGAKTRIEVSHYTRPGDRDSAPGIRQALAKAKLTGDAEVVFERGRYILRDYITHPTEGIVHDAGSAGIQPEKDCHLLLHETAGLTLRGAVDDAGEPATILVGWNNQINHSLLPAIIWCETCPDLKLENLAFTREPLFTSAGLITEATHNHVIVDVFPDCPAWDGMAAYCANRFSSDGSTLLGESITYGGGAGINWQEIGPNRLKLASPLVAAKVQTGEQLSWHQGAQTDFQVYVAHSNNLHLENLRTYNCNGFGLLTESCHNITAHAVSFRPDGSRLFTGPRDAWKIFKCGGSINIDTFSVQGVRMDGQNMHSNWLYLKERINSKEAIFFCKYTYAPIEPGSLIEFYDKTTVDTRVVSSASYEGKAEFGLPGNLYRVRFTDTLPGYSKENTLCAAQCWEADHYDCRNSDFTNIAGAGHLVRYDHLRLHNNQYRNIMNPGVLLGAEMPTHAEGGHATDIHIEACDFDNCGFFPRYQTAGCIGVHSAGFDLPLNHDITITRNTFRNSKIGVHLMTARNVSIHGNYYENIGERLRNTAASTTSIHFADG